MYTIREGIEKIRSLASAWLTDQTTDGSTAMGEVTATLLNTNFEDVRYEIVRQQNPEEMEAEINLLLGRLETAKTLGTAACDQVIATCQEQTPALRDVAAERLRQVSVEGRAPDEDAQYTNGELADAAGCYAMHADETPDDLEAEGIPAFWPWEAEWWKPTDRRRNLVKAGALILAEIERLDRAELNKGLAEAALLQAGKDPKLYTIAEEARMDVIGQNGNDGLHYEASAGWVEWTGELCPVDDLDAMVWVRLEGVSEVRPGIARNWDWRTEPAMGRSRIVAYTLKDPAKAARP